MASTYQRWQTGSVGVDPGFIKISTDDNLATITTAGWMNGGNGAGLVPTSNDLVFIEYAVSDGTTVGIFNVSVASDGTITLYQNASDVVLPVTANHIAVFTNTNGAIGDDATTAINGGNLQAGLSGTAGKFVSYPSTASKGTLQFVATANAGNTDTIVTNAAMGQATTLTIPDPGDPTAAFLVAPSALINNNLVKASGTAGLVVDAGYKLLSGTSPTWGGGSTSHTFAITGLTTACVGAVNIVTSTNAVGVNSFNIPSNGNLQVVFSADPGANTALSYIFTTAAAS